MTVNTCTTNAPTTTAMSRDQVWKNLESNLLWMALQDSWQESLVSIMHLLFLCVNKVSCHDTVVKLYFRKEMYVDTSDRPVTASTQSAAIHSLESYIGSSIRDLRQGLRLTIAEISDQTEISRGMALAIIHDLEVNSSGVKEQL